MTDSAVATARPALVRQGLRLNYLTIAYNAVEAIVSLAAGLVAGSVALVGFGGLVARLRGRCAELHVTDMRPRRQFQALVIGDEVGYAPAWAHVHGPEENAEVLGRADAVAITGSALVNGTMGDLLSYAHRARLVAVYGASAGFIPDVLFERGVRLVQAHHVSAPAAFQEAMLGEMNLGGAIQRTQTFQALRPAEGGES
jgi:hypothetical protein